MAPEGVRNEGGNGKFDARRPPNPFCAKLAHSVRAENRSTENAQSASVPPPFPSPGSTPRSFLTPSRHLGPHTQAPRLRPPKPFIWEQQPALYASDRLFESRARAERRASTTLVLMIIMKMMIILMIIMIIIMIIMITHMIIMIIIMIILMIIMIIS